MTKKIHPMNARLLQDLKNTTMKESAHKAAPAALPKAPAKKSQHLSITLFKTDMEKIAAVHSLAASNGRRITASDVVKLALRSMSITPDLFTILDDIRADDGRINKA